MRWQTKKSKNIQKNVTKIFTKYLSQNEQANQNNHKIITKYLPQNEVANRKSKNVDVLNLASHICYKLGGGCDAHADGDGYDNIICMIL